MYLGAAAAFFVAGAGREVVRTAIDAAGDKTRQLRTVATVWGSAFANRLGVALFFLGLVVAWVSVSGSTFLWYRGALAVSATVMLVAVVASAGQSRFRHASRRLTAIARILTALLVSGTAADLVLRGWWSP